MDGNFYPLRNLGTNFPVVTKTNFDVYWCHQGHPGVPNGQKYLTDSFKNSDTKAWLTDPSKIFIQKHGSALPVSSGSV